jgi:hypothetical protein
LCANARADLSISNSTTTTSWNQVSGQSPFYVSLPSANLTGFTAQGQPGAGSAATAYTVLSETFTITNGGAGSLANGNTNYLLTGVAIIGGSQPANSSIHLYDVTSDLTASSGNPLQTASATYNFVANGDLFGSGNGLALTNTLSGTSQVLYNLTFGPFTYDQVVLSAGHTYSFEIWTPTTGGGFTWDRNSTADSGGQGMGSHDASLATNRVTINSLGLAGGAPRTFTLALYGTPTSAAATANTATNIVPLRYYTLDDFSTNGVGPQNPTNDDWALTTNSYDAGDISSVWTEWFGNGITSISFSNNVNVSGNGYTNTHGAMAINLTWNGPATDG